MVVVDTDATIQGLILADPTLVGAGAVDTVRVDAIPSDGSNTAYDLRTFTAPSIEDWPLSFGVAADEASFDGPVLLRIRAFAGRLARAGELAGEATLDPPGTMTIDRLIELDPPAAGVRTVHVVLRADCTGVPTHFTDPPTTCLDGDAGRGSPREGLRDLVDAAAAPKTAVGSWGGAGESPCAVPAPAEVDAVCIPGGFSILGDAELEGFSEDLLRALPLQPVEVSPFHLDRMEMTVGRYNALSRAGRLAGITPAVEAGPGDDRYCTWLGVDDPANDALPLNCISFAAAEAICAELGGSLPSEAQWEHAARGRGRGWFYPWGNTPPACCTASLSRSAAGGVSTECPGEGVEAAGSHPRSDACGGVGDESIDGVLDLGGSLAEPLRDAPKNFDDSACWAPGNGGGIALDPVCVDDTILSRAARGGYWNAGLGTAAVVLRNTASTGPTNGFRCAYPGGPR